MWQRRGRIDAAIGGAPLTSLGTGATRAIPAWTAAAVSRWELGPLRPRRRPPGRRPRWPRWCPPRGCLGRLTGRIGAVSIDHGTNGHGRNGHARRRRLTPKRNRGCLRLKRQRRVVR